MSLTIPPTVASLKGLSASCKLVYGHLYHHQATGNPSSIRAAAEALGMNQSTVRRCLETLEKKGWIVDRPGAGKSGQYVVLTVCKMRTVVGDGNCVQNAHSDPNCVQNAHSDCVQNAHSCGGGQLCAKCAQCQDNAEGSDEGNNVVNWPKDAKKAP
jgi:predicted transcriptional regulator of viral defense system